jgi:hypothetical protein
MGRAGVDEFNLRRFFAKVFGGDCAAEEFPHFDSALL